MGIGRGNGSRGPPSVVGGDNHRDHRGSDDEHEDGFDELLHERDPSEPVSEHGDSSCPRHSTDHVVDQEVPMFHFGGAGDDRGDGANHGDEAREENGNRSMVSTYERLVILTFEDPTTLVVIASPFHCK